MIINYKNLIIITCWAPLFNNNGYLNRYFDKTLVVIFFKINIDTPALVLFPLLTPDQKLRVQKANRAILDMPNHLSLDYYTGE